MANAQFISAYTPVTAQMEPILPLVPGHPSLDPLWNNVVLFASMDTGITDLKGHTATSLNVETTIGNFSGYGAVQRKAAEQYSAIEYSTSTDWDFGLEDFTIECWIKPDDTTYRAGILGTSNLTYTSSIYIAKTSMRIEVTLRFSNSSTYTINTGTSVLSTGVWLHFALVRHAGIFYTYVNGATHAVYSGNTGLSLLYTTGDTFNSGGILANDTSGGRMIGGIRDVRVTKGVARYIAPFIAPTAALLSNIDPRLKTATYLPQLQTFWYTFNPSLRRYLAAIKSLLSRVEKRVCSFISKEHTLVRIIAPKRTNVIDTVLKGGKFFSPKRDT